MQCFNCDAPLGSGAIICGRCGMEQQEAAPEAAYRPPMAPSAGKSGVGFNDYSTGRTKGDGIGGFFKIAIGLLFLGGVTAATLFTVYRFQQNEKRQRTVTEMARMADLIEEYRALNHAYPDVSTIQELDKSLKSIAQKRLMNDFMPQMKGLMPPMPANPGGEFHPGMPPDLQGEMRQQDAPPEHSNPDIYYDPLGLNKSKPAAPPAAAQPPNHAPAPADRRNESRGFNIMQPIAPAPSPAPAPGYENESDSAAFPGRMVMPETPVMQMPVPDILGQLKMGGIQLQDSWSHDYRYIPLKDGYLLVSAGSDGRFETDDPASYKKRPADTRQTDLVIQNGKWLQAPVGTPGF